MRFMSFRWSVRNKSLRQSSSSGLLTLMVPLLVPTYVPEFSAEKETDNIIASENDRELAMHDRRASATHEH